MPEIPVPYKGRYTLKEFWDSLTQGSLWKAYKRANPIEAQFLELHVQRKIDAEADFIPVNSTHTFTGNALLMAILTLPAR